LFAFQVQVLGDTIALISWLTNLFLCLLELELLGVNDEGNETTVSSLLTKRRRFPLSAFIDGSCI
jgi:hypothetical protein